MGEANENNSKNKEMLNLSLELEKYPRDLLQKLPPAAGSQQSQRDKSPMSETEDIELSLGLSLGGRFGVDKHAKKNLFRSSSIAGPIPMAREFDRVIPPATANMFTATNTTAASGSQGVPYTGLVRTASLPTETEEEWRKRKEMQTLRRLAAKRRRNEKKNASGNCQKSDKVESNLDGEKQNNLPLGMKSCSVAARQAAGGGGGGGGFLQGFGQQPSQGFVEPQGGNSSGMFELEGKPAQGSSSGGGSQTLKDQSNQELAAGSHGKPNENSTQETEDTARKLERRNSRGGMRNSGEDMPSVFTDSPSGQRVEGILYKYGKGEEVRIMCICHGGFHSPLGFVKHAGHQDVGNPLRHIVVNPSAAPFP